MSVSVVKSGPYFSSGSISFSQLRTNFTDDQPNFGSQISASQLRRDTDLTRENPIVPDATENEGISTGSNLSLSQFRNSVKRYVATQTGTDDNAGDSNRPGFRMGRLQPNGTGIDWSGGGVTGRDGSSGPGNGNQVKNVQKGINITGTCGSNYSGQPAAAMTGVLHNVRIDISGSILGYGGKGGGQAGSSDPSGQDGGTAILLGDCGYNNRIRVNGVIWGGGGGGERGKNGANGANGTCVETTRTQGCGGKPGCPSGFSEVGQWSGGCCQSYCTGWGPWQNCNNCSQYLQGRNCERRTTMLGGLGGIGGLGGNGRGYNNQSGSTSGSAGLLGQASTATCGGSQSPPPERGKDGERGGNGGDWGQSGESTGNTGNGGSAGAAIKVNSGSLDLYGDADNPNRIKGSKR